MKLARFDPASRSTVEVFLRRVVIYFALATINFVPLHLRPPAEMLAVFEIACFTTALVISLMAALRRQSAWGPTLNLWDESLALNALALLAHGLHTVWPA